MFMEKYAPCGWLVGMLLVSKSGLVEKRMPLKCSITLVFTCPLLSRCTISSLFRENNNVVVFPFPLHIFMPLAPCDISILICYTMTDFMNYTFILFTDFITLGKALMICINLFSILLPFGNQRNK